MAAILEAVTEALEIVAPALPPSHCTHAATMRCDVPCDRDASDATAIRNARATIYFLLLHHYTVDHLVLFFSSAVIPPVADGKVARQPCKGWGIVLGSWERVFTPRSLVPVFTTHEEVPLSLFTFSPTNAMSSALLIDIAPTRWFRGLER